MGRVRQGERRQEDLISRNPSLYLKIAFFSLAISFQLFPSFLLFIKFRQVYPIVSKCICNLNINGVVVKPRIINRRGRK